MMSRYVVERLNFAGRRLLGHSFAAAILVLLLGAALPARFFAQAAPAANPQDIAGTWQGTLHAGRDLRIVIKITKDDKGGYKAVFYSIDQGGQPLPVTSITEQGTAIKMTLTAIGGTYEGKLSADGNSIAGNWSQGGQPLPLNLTRATPETAWTIPEPPPVIPPMAADANPSFEVATIKPSKPDQPGRAFRVQGRRFSTYNTTLAAIISFAYRVHPKEIVGAPDWVSTDKFDIEAQPDGEGQPSDKQWRSMLQKLLADRFKLTFHREKKDLAVYALSVAKGGPKLTKSEGDPNGLPGLFFRRLGELNVRNANMGDFAELMQSAVLDKPVVDQTGLTGRFDFTLNWTPDDSQFDGMGVRPTPPADAANAPPSLYTAIQEQIGLKLDATKAPADVFVIDHVEKPSEN
jgi:uncharacterized protein (TIGR03435 family)